MNVPDTKLVPLSLALWELQRMDGPDAKLVPLSHCLATLTAPTKHLYHAYRISYRRLHCLPHVIPVFTLFPVGQSPIKPGGGGATPSLKIHDAS